MLLRSFTREHRRLIPVEVELTLWPGLPAIQFVGLPDQQIKESALRIKSAIKAQGFEFPKAQQILVNLRPNALKKSSQGLELAVALAYLMESEQIPRLEEDILQKAFVYGSLSLSGEVTATEELSQLRELENGSLLITGAVSEKGRPLLLPHASIVNLQSLKEKLEFKNPVARPSFVRPKIDTGFLWTESEADFLCLAASGGHHALLAGPSGSGKSTMAKLIYQLLPAPQPQEVEGTWWPLARPHHSVTLRGLLGGGADIGEGEISRAHKGVLFLDEFLEFRPEAIESLREPLEEGLVHLARGNQSEVLPARFQLLATTNLCPCGRWVPGLKKTYCRFTLSRCRSYSQRLSGPILDRFQILYFVFRAVGQAQEERKVSPERLMERVNRAHHQRLKREQRKANAFLSLEEIQTCDPEIVRARLLPESIGSERRRLATLRVARSFADLAGRKHIHPEDLQRSLKYTYSNFQAANRWD